MGGFERVKRLIRHRGQDWCRVGWTERNIARGRPKQICIAGAIIIRKKEGGIARHFGHVVFMFVLCFFKFLFYELFGNEK